MDYKASKGMTINIVTSLVILLFVFISYKSILGIKNSGGNSTILITNLSVVILLGGILLFCYLYSPRKYSIDKEKLTIHRSISDINIPIKSISEIRRVDNMELTGMVRTLGVGGLFGNYGKFYAQRLGSITLYATQSKNYILIVADKKKYLITPDDMKIIDDVKENKLYKN
jgi:hypothetical protein